MSLVRAKDTSPELFVRRLVYSLGYRYRLHAGDLPGKPDIVFRSRRKAIFVHGCFWHRHEGCHLARLPKSKLEFWLPKLDGNKERDQVSQAELTGMGWKYLIVWECELARTGSLKQQIQEFLAEA
ncbi:MAG: very short patch repair endonuclease [Syntrophobacteraceae bacterium]|jgi:DNA mismatch endonuclease (patch repair protein)|nr:very short patch repair endonuclease [Syntrophobacteraceae bacterium]